MAIILKKGEETVLVNDKGMPVLNLTVGANWGKINRLGSAPKAGFIDRLIGNVAKVTGQLEDVDLDLSLLFFNGSKEFVEKCYFGNKTLFGGAVSHTGDDLTGDDEVDEADNERIKFKGAVIPMTVQTVFVVLNSYRHQNFGEIPFVGFSIYDGLYGLGDKAPRL
ncbi:TerD family protein, partial [Herbiconiux daphne]